MVYSLRVIAPGLKGLGSPGLTALSLQFLAELKNEEKTRQTASRSP